MVGDRFSESISKMADDDFALPVRQRHVLDAVVVRDVLRPDEKRIRFFKHTNRRSLKRVWPYLDARLFSRGVVG